MDGHIRTCQFIFLVFQFENIIILNFKPPPLILGVFFFEFSMFWGPANYVYKIWLSLLKGPRFLFLPPPPNFGFQKTIFSFQVQLIVYFTFLVFQFENIIILIFNPPPLILGRYAPKSNQLLISKDPNYMSSLVLKFTLVFELARSQKFGNAQNNRLTNRHFDKTVIISKNIIFSMFT